MGENPIQCAFDGDVLGFDSLGRVVLRIVTKDVKLINLNAANDAFYGEDRLAA